MRIASECSEQSRQDSENESFDPAFRMESVNVSNIPHYNEVENDGITIGNENTESEVEQDTDEAVERYDADGEELVPVVVKRNKKNIEGNLATKHKQKKVLQMVRFMWDGRKLMG